jgi:hypothetical protein
VVVLQAGWLQGQLGLPALLPPRQAVDVAARLLLLLGVWQVVVPPLAWQVWWLRAEGSMLLRQPLQVPVPSGLVLLPLRQQA